MPPTEAAFYRYQGRGSLAGPCSLRYLSSGGKRTRAMTASSFATGPPGPGGFGLLTFLFAATQGSDWVSHGSRGPLWRPGVSRLGEQASLSLEPSEVRKIRPAGECAELYQRPAHRAAQAALWNGAHDQRRGAVAPAASNDSGRARIALETWNASFFMLQRSLALTLNGAAPGSACTSSAIQA